MEPIDPIPSPSTGKRLAWNPALVIGAVATVIGAGLAAYQGAQGTGVPPLLAAALVVVPMVQALATKLNVTSNAWLRDIIAVAQTQAAVVQPVAQAVSAPPETVPTRD